MANNVFMLTIFILGCVLGVIVALALGARRIGKLNQVAKQLQEEFQNACIEKAVALEKANLAVALRNELELYKKDISGLYEKNSELQRLLGEKSAAFDELKSNAFERLAESKKAHEELSSAFRSLSADALRDNNKSFLEVAKSTIENWQASSSKELQKYQGNITDVVNPLKESLKNMSDKVHELEVAREGAYRDVHRQMNSIADIHNELRQETGRLNKALYGPTVRGKWGEIQLRRVIELAGMLPHCDFDEQPSFSFEGKEYRPDLIVRLPHNRSIIIDAKVPLGSFFKAVERNDPADQKELLKEHAEQVRKHISALSKKSYWKMITPTPEFVVMFLPGEAYFSAALAWDAGLIEAGVNQGVIVATPTTLIALLRAVAYGWKQDSLDKNAAEITALAQVLCERVSILSDHFEKLGKNISGAVESYNQTLGSLETRVFATAKKLGNLGGVPTEKERKELSQIEKTTRRPSIQHTLG